jgi:DNA polymerase I
VAERYLPIQLDKSLQNSDWFGDLFTDQLAYAARDAAVLLPLRESLRGRLLKDGLKVVTSIEFRCVPTLALMELTGVPIDVKAWIARGDEENRRVIELEKRLDHAAGRQINWSSPEQVLKVFKGRGHDVNRTNEAVLHQLAAKDSVASLLLEHREASKLTGTYGIDWVAKHVSEVTGRVHCDYLQLGCSTGRMSCTKPNMQNIPRGPRLRSAIRATSDKRLIKADMSQVELRIAAVLSGDTAMLAAYERGEDLHVATASRLLNVPRDTVTKEQRQLAKAVNFGFVYGMGAKTFQTYAQSMFGVNLTEVEAARYRCTFFRIYPGLHKWHRSIEEGTVDTRTLTGRVRHGVSRFTDKLNTPDQGTGADGLKLALARLYEDRLGHGSPVLAIHDERVVEALDAGDAEWLVRHMTEAMSEVLGHQCPVVVDNTIGEQWC